MKYYIGVDLGGTNIAVGIVDKKRKLIAKKIVPTNCPRSANEIVNDIVNTVFELIKSIDISLQDIYWLGIGTPGSVNSKSGIIESAHNLGFYDLPLRDLIQEKINLNCFIENDANAAAYGELLAGSALGARNAICITIGTGLGGGIIINKKIYSGSNYYGGEFGHTVIEFNGKECNCGRKGCLERYCSATAFIEQTKDAMLINSDSLLWRECDRNIDKVSGKTAFDAMRKGDKTAARVIEKFTEYLACGCTNFINIFQPDVLIIGGGISKEGETLLSPLRKIISRDSFDKNPKRKTKIAAASLGNDAGIIGAALLGMLHK